MSRNVLLVGATSGIGYQIAATLTRGGDNVILVGRNSEKLQKMALELSISQGNVFEFDNEKIEEVKFLFSQIVGSVGKLDALIFSAGHHEVKPLRVAKVRDLNKVFKLNTESAFLFAKYFSSPLYSVTTRRAIVFIASIASVVGEAGLMGYRAAKAGLVAGARCMAVELAGKSIRVNCISPGWVNTEHAKSVELRLGADKVEDIRESYPLGFGEPEYIADACEFLISDKAKWITGQNLIVDGGRSIL